MATESCSLPRRPTSASSSGKSTVSFLTDSDPPPLTATSTPKPSQSCSLPDVDAEPAVATKRLRSLSMDEADVPPTSLSKSKSASHIRKNSQLPVLTPRQIKEKREMVEDRIYANRQARRIDRARNTSSSTGAKLMTLKSTVFDPTEVSTAEQTALSAKVARAREKDAMRRAKEAKNAAKNANRRRSISMGEKDFMGGGSMRFVEAITDTVTAKERREEYGNRVQRQNSTKDNLYSVGREILASVLASLRAERAAIMFVDKKTDEFFFYTTPHTTYRFSNKKGIAGWVYKSGLVANVADAYEDERFNKDVDAQSGFVTRNILCCPVAFGGSVVAVLQFVNKRGGDAFDSRDALLVSETADRLGQVVGDALNMLDE